MFWKTEVEDYTNNVLKKNVIHSYKEVNIPNFEGDENNFNNFFIETNIDEDHEIDIWHL